MTTQHSITVAEVERFLVDEAALLDEWRLEEWPQLFAEDARYLIPSLDSPDSDHRTALFLIADDMTTLKSRVAQLLGRSTWSENPRSRTRRLVTNFRVLEAGENGTLVTANFAVWRFQHEVTDVYVGRYRHLLVRDGDQLKFKERRAILDLESLRPHGKLSFIL
jgi:p-cumate 2,3-dioxygenase beta subunit